MKKKINRLRLLLYLNAECKMRFPRVQKGCTSQEFKDPVCEGFRNFLELDKNDSIQAPCEAGEDYLEKVIEMCFGQTAN